ncbi:hypothetical protein [Micromonospora sp. CPCC 205561]|uniref:hypothetical protein n=1 Tax=Micromonospora sp. CPCC 205561 TaxID=3122407 RepID=UPI002FEF61E7
MPIPVPIARVRRKLVVFAALTGVAALADLPGWTVVALGLTSLAIPLAVTAVGGAALTRELLLPRRGAAATGGLGHTAEQGERFVT